MTRARSERRKSRKVSLIEKEFSWICLRGCVCIRFPIIFLNAIRRVALSTSRVIAMRARMELDVSAIPERPPIHTCMNRSSTRA